MLNSRTLAAIGFATAGLIHCALPAQAAGGDPFGGQFNNYQCYEVLKTDGKIQNNNVTVTDQFGKYGQYVAKLRYVCNPVSIDGQRVPEPEVHLACFITDPNNNSHLKEQQVLTSNRFGDQKSVLNRVSQLLCVTSKKEHLK